MSWVDSILPESWLTPEQKANRSFDHDHREQALEGLRDRLDELREAEMAYEGIGHFVELKQAELDKIQDALVFSRGDETLILQGRAQGLYEFVKAPERLRTERMRVEMQIADIENPTPG